MAKKPLPEQSYLLQRLRYDPQTGRLLWRHYEPHGGRWNGRWAGKPALSKIERNGYMRGDIDAVSHLAHRVIWKMMTGEDPFEIDHINGVRSDNRWGNLRQVGSGENNKNRRFARKIQSGCVGVHWESDRKKWRATIGANGDKLKLGRYDTLEDAIRARYDAEKKYGYHFNHGSS